MRQATGTTYQLGTEKEKDGMNFAVAAESGKKCELLLYKKGSDVPVKVFTFLEKNAVGMVRSLKLIGLKEELYEYNYRIDGTVFTDPYAKSVVDIKIRDGELEETVLHGCFVNQDYDWEDDRLPHIPYHEVIAYGIHIRGFTKHQSSGVKHKGTFLGVIEKLAYLKELGINQIQCMPVYEFQKKAGKKINYWGYGNGHYFAPKASYSASKDSCTELKDMVKACHKQEIEVVLEMPFEAGILPQMALQCLQYYRMEYHIDGFVLNPYHVPWDMMFNDPILKDVKIMRKNDWFQNTVRRFLKSDAGMIKDMMEALKHNSAYDGECNYITSNTGFTLYDLVSYNEKHNEDNGEQNQDGPDYNYSWNCGEEGQSRKRYVNVLRNNQIRNAFFLLLTAQGTPCILAGDEFKNTQLGNNNAYCQDNEISWLNWKNLKKEKELFEYVKKVISLRKEHWSLHKAELLEGRDQTGCGIPDVSYHGENAWKIQMEKKNRELGVMYHAVQGKKQDICFLAYNMHWDKREFSLPVIHKKNWYKIFNTADVTWSGKKELIEAKSISVEGRSIVMLIAE